MIVKLIDIYIKRNSNNNNFCLGKAWLRRQCVAIFDLYERHSCTKQNNIYNENIDSKTNKLPLSVQV
jgi:hypothetical protein